MSAVLKTYMAVYKGFHYDDMRPLNKGDHVRVSQPGLSSVGRRVYYMHDFKTIGDAKRFIDHASARKFPKKDAYCTDCLGYGKHHRGCKPFGT